jgi:hypothetical protein
MGLFEKIDILPMPCQYILSLIVFVIDHQHHQHKHPGLGHLAHSVSRVTVALSIVSLVSQLFSFLVGCSGNR